MPSNRDFLDLRNGADGRPTNALHPFGLQYSVDLKLPCEVGMGPLTLIPASGGGDKMTPSPLLPLYLRNCKIYGRALLGHCPGPRGLFITV